MYQKGKLLFLRKVLHKLYASAALIGRHDLAGQLIIVVLIFKLRILFVDINIFHEEFVFLKHFDVLFLWFVF